MAEHTCLSGRKSGFDSRQGWQCVVTTTGTTITTFNGHEAKWIGVGLQIPVEQVRFLPRPLSFLLPFAVVTAEEDLPSHDCHSAANQPGLEGQKVQLELHALDLPELIPNAALHPKTLMTQ